MSKRVYPVGTNVIVTAVDKEDRRLGVKPDMLGQVVAQDYNAFVRVHIPILKREVLLHPDQFRKTTVSIN